MPYLEFRQGLVDFGAPEIVTVGLGRVQIVGQRMIRFTMYNEHIRSDGGFEFPINCYLTMPTERFLAAHLAYTQAAEWVCKRMKDPAMGIVGDRMARH